MIIALAASAMIVIYARTATAPLFERRMTGRRNLVGCDTRVGGCPGYPQNPGSLGPWILGSWFPVSLDSGFPGTLLFITTQTEDPITARPVNRPRGTA